MIKIKYRRLTVKVDAERRKTCETCGKACIVNFHHWKYAYTTKQVRKDPKLALENTIQVCFNPCHRVADAIRVCESNPATRDLILKKIKAGGHE